MENTTPEDKKDDGKEDITSLDNAYDWTPEEEEQLNRAFYGTGRGCDGAGYEETVRRLLRERQERAAFECFSSTRTEESVAKDAADTTPLPEAETKDNSSVTAALYLGGIALLVIAYMMAKYSFVGSMTISVGVITSIAVRLLRRVQVKNEYGSQSLSFWIVVVFGTIFASIFGVYWCMKLAETVHEVSGGETTPWDVFTLVVIVIGGLFVCLWQMKNRTTGWQRKLVLVLLYLSVGAIVSQGLGSYFCTRRIQDNRWETKSALVDFKKVELEKNLVGTWSVSSMPDAEGFSVFGVSVVKEEFRADGTWQREYSDGKTGKGRWTVLSRSKLKIEESKVKVDGKNRSSDNEWTVEIVKSEPDEISCKLDGIYFSYKRK